MPDRSLEFSVLFWRQLPFLALVCRRFNFFCCADPKVAFCRHQKILCCVLLCTPLLLQPPASLQTAYAQFQHRPPLLYRPRRPQQFLPLQTPLWPRSPESHHQLHLLLKLCLNLVLSHRLVPCCLTAKLQHLYHSRLHNCNRHQQLRVLPATPSSMRSLQVPPLLLPLVTQVVHQFCNLLL